jgi:hypothetical protein
MTYPTVTYIGPAHPVRPFGAVPELAARAGEQRNDAARPLDFGRPDRESRPGCGLALAPRLASVDMERPTRERTTW